MLIPTKIRKTILEALFKDGVMVAKKDYNAPKHHELDVPNLYVINLMRSLKSKGMVKENFNWQWFYWFLTNEGIEYLRDLLHFPEEVVPDTLKKPRAAARAPVPGGRPAPSGERRRAFPDEKKVAPSGDFKPDFRGGQGFGRGRGVGRESYRSAPSGDKGAQ